MASAAQDEYNELMRDKERRTTHPEDANSDARSFLNLSDDEPDNDRTPPASTYDADETLPRSSTSTARHVIPRKRYGANTGPKGVISDAQNFRDSQRNHRTSLRSLVGGSSAQQQQQYPDEPQRHWTQEPNALEKLEEGEDAYDEDADLDDGFMNKWRQGRLKELQNGAYESNLAHSGRRKKAYGGLTTVDGEGYLDAVEKSPPQTVVVVYIYDDMSHVSQMIEDCVRTLAQKHNSVRFVRLHYQDAEMEPAGVPALLAYRGGDKFAGLVPIMEEMPDDADLSALTLEVVLQKHQIL
ncbi:hypothetical protein Q7P37_001683 [Cladosporium fusiforme]